VFYLSIDAIYSKLTKLYCSNCMLPCQSGGVYLIFLGFIWLSMCHICSWVRFIWCCL